jgi:hypothetical protein
MILGLDEAESIANWNANAARAAQYLSVGDIRFGRLRPAVERTKP